MPGPVPEPPPSDQPGAAREERGGDDTVVPPPAGSLASIATHLLEVTRPAPDLPEEIRTWVGEHRLRVPPELRTLSIKALDQVAADSELVSRMATMPTRK